MNNLNIIYEDNHIIVVEKPVNMLSQSDNTKDLDLQTALKMYIKEKYHKPGNVYIGLVHRLDRPTGGLMVFARTSKSASRLSEEIRNKSFKKSYLAVINGKTKEKDTLEDYLEKQGNISIISTKEKGKYAKLDYELIAYKDNLSLVKVNLETGRNHQIRLQFKSRNMPLYGDNKYNNEKNKNLGLYAYKLEFTHPTKKEKMVFINYPTYSPFNKFKNLSQID
ncbi:MAG: RluA family pseudouridine synthase [Erysipelotrichaceae bacterium]|nr:RluA family pseudouridine synthase [Erysipelotrichaceae bacterium]